MSAKYKEPCSYFLNTVRNDLNDFIDCMDYAEIEAAADLILKAQKHGGRVHISGIGKPGHISGYIASLMSSTGNPAYFLHGTEAVHGSCGQLVPGDVVIFISNSGETAEMRAAVSAVKKNGCAVIGVSSNRSSWLANESTVHMYAGVPQEGGPLGRAPRMSILAETVLLQALSVALQADKEVTPQQYVKWHPGGMLGQLHEE